MPGFGLRLRLSPCALCPRPFIHSCSGAQNSRLTNANWCGQFRGSVTPLAASRHSRSSSIQRGRLWSRPAGSWSLCHDPGTLSPDASAVLGGLRRATVPSSACGPASVGPLSPWGCGSPRPRIRPRPRSVGGGVVTAGRNKAALSFSRRGRGWSSS